MSRSDPNKLAVWRARLERFARRGMAVAPFCAREGVSEASFYHWRKKLGLHGRRRRTAGRRGVFQPVTVVPATSEAMPRPPTVCIQLPCGTRMEVCAEHVDAIRAVVAEVARAGRTLEREGESC